MQLDLLFNVSIILVLLSNFILPKSRFNFRWLLVTFIFISLGIYVVFGEYIHISDMARYYHDFEVSLHRSLEYVIHIHSFKSPAYYICENIFGKLIPIPIAWIYFIIFSFLLVVSYVIYKESKNPYLSFLLFIILGFFGFCLLLLKQEVAMIFILFAFLMLKKQKLFLFILFVAIASLFHLTAVLFLIVYPIAYKKISWIHLVVAIGVITIFLIGENYLREAIQFIFNEGYYARYANKDSELSYVTFFMQLLLFILYLNFYKNTIKNEPNSIVLYNLCFLGLIFQLFAAFIAEFFRISYYFSFYNLLLLPIVLENISKDEILKKNITLSITFLFIVFIILKYILKIFL